VGVLCQRDITSHFKESIGVDQTGPHVPAEISNTERYCTHFSAFDLSAKPGFFFIRVSLVSKPLNRGDAEIAEAEDWNSLCALRIASL
jgi:hypothetical protein